MSVRCVSDGVSEGDYRLKINMGSNTTEVDGGFKNAYYEIVI